MPYVNIENHKSHVILISELAFHIKHVYAYFEYWEV